MVKRSGNNHEQALAPGRNGVDCRSFSLLAFLVVVMTCAALVVPAISATRDTIGDMPTTVQEQESQRDAAAGSARASDERAAESADEGGVGIGVQAEGELAGASDEPASVDASMRAAADGADATSSEADATSSEAAAASADTADDGEAGGSPAASDSQANQESEAAQSGSSAQSGPSDQVDEAARENQDDEGGQDASSGAAARASKPRKAVRVTDRTDVTVTASLLGTDMKSLGYNLYAYLLASNDNTAYGAKVEFANGNATATIPNVPANTYKLYLVYARDNRALQVPTWNYGNVLDQNTNNWVDATGGYIFGFSARMPDDKDISPSDNTVSFALEVPAAQSTASVGTIMDRAINYGITAESIEYNVRSYTNFAAKSINIRNSNDSTTYGHRTDGVDVVPNILASVENNGQPLSTGDKPANYYVVEADKDKVSSANTEETIVRNHNEIADRVEIMLENTLRQCATLAAQSVLTLPKVTSVDFSPYADNATIIVDATAISGEQNGFTIVKRPGQTIVFNMNGQNVAPPQNIKVKLVNANGVQVDVDGNPSTKTYKAGDEMRNAAASEGNVWNKIVWNFPDATSVTATNCVGGIFLVPNGDFTVGNKGGGWIVARGKVSVTNEWYGFPGSDEPFKQKIIRKTFVGIDESKINSAYEMQVLTHVNESTSGTTHEEKITSLVLKPADDTSLVSDPTGANDQTGYLTKGTDEDGNIVYEWKTPPLSVGNEHRLTESNSTGNSGQQVELVEFTGPYSAWSEASQNYEWTSREMDFDSEASMNSGEAVFNVSAHNDDYRQYVYVTNNYTAPEGPLSLSLTKAVVDPEGLAAAGQEYSFAVGFTDADGNYLARDVHYAVGDGAEQTVAAGGMFTIALKAGETARFSDLPYGTRYQVRELDVPSKCEATYSGDGAGAQGASSRLVRDRSVTVTNTFSDDPGVPVTAHKDLIGGVLRAGQFTFRLVDGEGQVVKEAVNDANGLVSFGTLTFESDGEYTYHLYEVADPHATDVIYDASVHKVHITVAGGRARSVTYENEATGATETVPMFANTQIPTDSDTLTARKVLIDRSTDKAVQLSGGEFAFTATSSDETPVVYTGTNGADGMVVFHDAGGNEVNLDDLDQPTTFTIAETSGSYAGQLATDQTIEYDGATYGATAEVTTTTVTASPVTVEASGNDAATVSITFTPSQQSSLYYFTKPDGGAGSVVPRSDGTVTMSIPISKNQTGTDGTSRQIRVEYGVGDYNNDYWSGSYRPHERLGEIVITAKGGNWGAEPITVQRVTLDGNQLSSTTRIEKTVNLVYDAGSYPVFVNYLDSTTPDTTEFTFTKVWTDNASYTTLRPWEAGREIEVELTGTFAPDEAGAAGATQSYTFKAKCVQHDGGEEGFEFTQPAGDGVPTIAVAPSGGGANRYAFTISGLPHRATVEGHDGTWTYRLTENAPEGFAVHYGAWNETEQKVELDPTESTTGIVSGQYVVNASVSVELPSTGGSGVAWLYAMGIACSAGAALYGARAFRRRRA